MSMLLAGANLLLTGLYQAVFERYRVFV